MEGLRTGLLPSVRELATSGLAVGRPYDDRPFEAGGGLVVHFDFVTGLPGPLLPWRVRLVYQFLVDQQVGALLLFVCSVESSVCAEPGCPGCCGTDAVANRPAVNLCV